ncbi:unnamed protein product [Lampetra planeri]
MDPALPLRILNKGPDYFRRPADEPSKARVSAVERLEADKAKYVKSKEVVSTKQQPIKPCAPARPPLCTAVRRTHSPARTGGQGPSTATAMCDLADASRAGPGLAGLSSSPRGGAAASMIDVFSAAAACSGAGDGRPPPPAHAGHQPQAAHAGYPGHGAPPPHPPAFPSYASPCHAPHGYAAPASQFGLAPAPELAAPGPAGSSGSGWRPALQRSKSDLSSRLARTGADIERFFNYCGLDPALLEGDGLEGLARAGSDILSLNLQSASVQSLSSAPSHRSSQVEAEERQRAACAISVVERNARVIKWLYSCRQAVLHQKASVV